MHALQNLVGCERADFSGRIHRVANFQRAHPVHELVEKLIVDFVCNKESLCCNA